MFDLRPEINTNGEIILLLLLYVAGCFVVFVSVSLLISVVTTAVEDFLLLCGHRKRRKGATLGLPPIFVVS